MRCGGQFQPYRRRLLFSVSRVSPESGVSLYCGAAQGSDFGSMHSVFFKHISERSGTSFTISGYSEVIETSHGEPGTSPQSQVYFDAPIHNAALNALSVAAGY